MISGQRPQITARASSGRAFGINPRQTPAPESSVSSSATPADFDCPEEFGYYPHPTDCTQYYVCVFGGALLESCTGGLMYSNELQTCDWPRNVGCDVSQPAQVQQYQPSRIQQSQYISRGPPQNQQQQYQHQQQQPQQQQQQQPRIRFTSVSSTISPAPFSRGTPSYQHLPPPPELKIAPNPVITSRGQPKQFTPVNEVGLPNKTIQDLRSIKKLLEKLEGYFITLACCYKRNICYTQSFILNCKFNKTLNILLQQLKKVYVRSNFKKQF